MTDQAFFKLFVETTDIKNDLASLMKRHIDNDSHAPITHYEEMSLKMDSLLAELSIQLNYCTQGPEKGRRIVANKEKVETLNKKIHPFIADVAQDVEILNFFQRRATDELSTPGALLGTVIEKDLELAIEVARVALEGIENKRMMAELNDFLDASDTTCAIM